ncbi:DUF6461 domain-containing protein [Sphaerisporangium perillae]|uniref:DUF6461 domain-containing protein n=1 Tax=Sphaerisporangium perillae TaxID=2935860 RepID=UPI00200FEE48|nr:DUF6461 domain-containing protein [Sphaerisporangium perillae]
MTDPACVTWCSGIDVEEAARRFGADPASGTPMTFTDAEMEHYDEALQTVLIGSLDGWTIAMEPNGGEGRSPDTIASLSNSDQAFSIYWDGPVKIEMNYAAHGHLITSIPKSLVDDWPPAARVPLVPHTHGLPFTTALDEQWKIAAFTLAARLSGVHLTDRWLETEHSRFVISTLL